MARIARSPIVVIALTLIAGVALAGAGAQTAGPGQQAQSAEQLPAASSASPQPPLRHVTDAVDVDERPKEHAFGRSGRAISVPGGSAKVTDR